MGTIRLDPHAVITTLQKHDIRPADQHELGKLGRFAADMFEQGLIAATQDWFGGELSESFSALIVFVCESCQSPNGVPPEAMGLAQCDQCGDMHHYAQCHECEEYTAIFPEGANPHGTTDRTAG